MLLVIKFAKTLFIAGILVLISTANHAQAKYEISLKPLELIYKNLELNIAAGTDKTKHGVILSYRPSTKESGKVQQSGSGMYSFDFNAANHLYQSYTLGVYRKSYFKKRMNNFYEVDLFYRNWNYEKKQAELRNVESYRYNGMRTENVDVYAFKILMGETRMLSRKQKISNPFIDIYLGIGVRYKLLHYQTFNGTVYDIFYTYKDEHSHRLYPTAHLGVKVGLKTGKNPRAAR